jgi:Rrf2 family nitric oxide-sensitive transcriptional repressor
MRLTLYTDYTLRVMMYLAVKHREGGSATIEEMARAYDISRSHLMKIVNELAQTGFIETTRGRAGGTRLARAPKEISIGELVRMAEKDFAVVACHDSSTPHNCVIFQACNLKRGLARAVDAFMMELDRMTLEDAIGAPTIAASLLGVTLSMPDEVQAVAMSMPVPGSGKKREAPPVAAKPQAKPQAKTQAKPQAKPQAETRAKATATAAAVSAKSAKSATGRRPRRGA